MNQDDGGSLWSVPILQAYFAFVKTLKPEISAACKQILSAYYKKQRQADIKSSARTTIRLLESLIRTTEAHARLMCRTVATVQDAVTAVLLVEASMQTSALLGVSSALHSVFPEDPDAEYLKQEAMLLRQLGLEHLCSLLHAKDEDYEDMKDPDVKGEPFNKMDTSRHDAFHDSSSPSPKGNTLPLVDEGPNVDQQQSEEELFENDFLVPSNVPPTSFQNREEEVLSSVKKKFLSSLPLESASPESSSSLSSSNSKRPREDEWNPSQDLFSTGPTNRGTPSFDDDLDLLEDLEDDDLPPVAPPPVRSPPPKKNRKVFLD